VVLIGDHWTGLDRTRLVGRNTAVLTVGLASIPLLSGLVTEIAGWRVTFALYTIALGTAAVAWVVLDGRRPATPPSVKAQLGEAWVVIRQPLPLATIIGSFLTFTLIFAVFLTVFPVHLAERFGLEAGMRGAMISIPAITSTLVAYNLGRIRAAVSARTTVIITSLGMASAFLIIGLTGALVVAGVGALLYGASSGSLVPTLQDLNISGSPDEHRAAVVAVFVSAARLGQTVGPLLAGMSVGLVGTGPTIAIGAAATLLLLVLGVYGPFPRFAETAKTPSR
jgi:predicted MFS family arabinose efflux permease